MKNPLILLVVMALLPTAESVSSVPKGVFPVLLVYAGSPERGAVMGGSIDGRWVDAATMVPRVKGGERYTSPNLNVSATTHRGGKLIPIQEGPCQDYREVPLTPSLEFIEGDEEQKIALLTSWNPRPRRPTVLSPANLTYQKVVADFLRTKGIQKPQVRITRLVRVDLEGDGQDEVILSATRHGFGDLSQITPNATAGDYSILLVRKIVAGKLQTFALEAEVYPTSKEFNAPNIKTYRDVLDLNGDGRLEIVFSSDYYEGSYTGVYDWQRTKFVEVIGTGCGV
jgi:hypothetical protein